MRAQPAPFHIANDAHALPMPYCTIQKTAFISVVTHPSVVRRIGPLLYTRRRTTTLNDPAIDINKARICSCPQCFLHQVQRSASCACIVVRAVKRSREYSPVMLAWAIIPSISVPINSPDTPTRAGNACREGCDGNNIYSLTMRTQDAQTKALSQNPIRILLSPDWRFSTKFQSDPEFTS